MKTMQINFKNLILTFVLFAGGTSWSQVAYPNLQAVDPKNSLVLPNDDLLKKEDMDQQITRSEVQRNQNVIGNDESIYLVKKLMDQYGVLIKNDEFLSFPFTIVSNELGQKIILDGVNVGYVHGSSPQWLRDQHIYYIKKYQGKNFLIRKGGLAMVDIQIFDLGDMK